MVKSHSKTSKNIRKLFSFEINLLILINRYIFFRIVLHLELVFFLLGSNFTNIGHASATRFYITLTKVPGD